jgi:hypothetical protein
VINLLSRFSLVYIGDNERNSPITPIVEQAIIAALEKTPHASLVARKVGRSFSTVSFAEEFLSPRAREA